MPTSVTSSGITFPDLTTQTTAATGAGWTGQKIQVFSSSGTFTVPTGITAVFVQVFGAGGGGSGNVGGSGYFGMRGGIAFAYVSGLTPGGTVTVTIGSGGNGAASGNGSTGGTTSFGSYVSCTGGSGGISNQTGTAGTYSLGAGATSLRVPLAGSQMDYQSRSYGYGFGQQIGTPTGFEPMWRMLSGMFFPFGGGDAGIAGFSTDGMCGYAAGGGGGGGGMNGGGGGGTGTAYATRASAGGAVFGPGAAGTAGTASGGGVGGGAGGAGGASATGGGGGGGGGVIVWW